MRSSTSNSEHANSGRLPAADRPIPPSAHATLDPGDAVPAAGHAWPAADLRRDTITLRQVTLAYPGRDRPALDRVGLTVRPGEHITLTGPSGAGKSSLLALLLRFTEPTGGTIEAGQADLAAIPVSGWLAQIAWVPQHPYLFAGSAAENIALGQPAASRESVVRAAGLAGAAGFIEQLPRGYDTPLGERGLRLSAGQRQKIAVARAFLRDAPLLLLDEPTAHLDPASAGQVRQVLGTLMAGRTVIHVTHRGADAPAAGRLLALDHGRLTQIVTGVPVTGRQDALTGTP